MIRYMLFCLIILLFPLYLEGQSETYTVEKTEFSKENYHEFSPAYFENGIVFTSNRKKGIFSYSTPENGGLFNLYVVDTSLNKKNQKAKIFSKDINTKMNDGPGSFSASHDTIYYTRNRLVEGRTSELSSEWNKLGIFSAVFKGEEWTEVQEFRFNNEWYNLTTPFLSPDGKRLYFASDMPEGFGGSDLYYSEWKNGFWDNPVNLGSVINTEGNEAYPFVNDAGYFFFSSDGHPGMGGRDIFITYQKGDTWKTPVALNPPINSEAEDFAFICDDLINTGYFSSNRDNSIDIYHFKTLFPQLYFVNYQREDNYCYSFHDRDSVFADTTRLNFLWNFGDGKSGTGLEINHCYPGPGEYKLSLDLVDKSTGNKFFRKLEYLLQISKLEQAYIESPDLAVYNEEIEFNASKSYLPGYTVLDFAWDLGDSTRIHGDTIRHKYAKTGEYDVTLFLELRSNSSGILKNTAITKKIKVVNNQLEKEYFITESEKKHETDPDIMDFNNTRLTTLFSAELASKKDAVFCIELLASEDRIALDHQRFRKLPAKYILKERYLENEKTYSYTIEQQMNLMSLYPSFRDIRRFGFENAQVKIISLEEASEIELLNLLKRYTTSVDAYFDSSERLTTDAYIMLDQIVNLLNEYPEISMEIGVHTDGTGPASVNLSISRQRAGIINDYLLNRGIDRHRISVAGYGEGKPIALNSNEKNREKNRRIEFTILK